MSGDYNIPEDEFSFADIGKTPSPKPEQPAAPEGAAAEGSDEGPVGAGEIGGAGSEPSLPPPPASGDASEPATAVPPPLAETPPVGASDAGDAPPAVELPPMPGAPESSESPSESPSAAAALPTLGMPPAPEPEAATGDAAGAPPAEPTVSAEAPPAPESASDAAPADPGAETGERPRLRSLRGGRRGRRGAAAPAPAPVPAPEAAPQPEAAGDARGPAIARRQFKGPTRREGAPVITGSTQSPRHMVQGWLQAMVKSQASDLILRAGGRPSLRVDGGISFLPGRVPGPGPLLEVLEGVMGSARMGHWGETGSADAAIQLDGLGRFRLNAYKQMGEPAVVIRRINENAPNLEDLDLPATQLRDLAMRRRGLVLVTGIAGSGKSTTLAGMIQHMNENIERHVVTLEDPVELLFKENRCVISQREVGTDTPTFQDGLRHALRQSPDVIFIGEVRDAETVVAALEATETGHLVISTMHTVNAAQTIDRILGFFPAERHKQIRQRMGDNLMGVLSQRLVPRRGGTGMVPAFELMVSTPHIRELLEEGKTGEIARVIESGSEAGLISFNECLRGLVEHHKIELEDALSASDRPEELLLALRGIRGSSGRVQGPGGAQPQQGQAPRQEPPESRPDGLRMAGSE